MAAAYDTPVPGLGAGAVLTLRLWAAQAPEDFKLRAFNQGQYTRAVEEKNRSENVTRVLYPDDTTHHGRDLRLRQGYFLVSASLQDILRRHQEAHGSMDTLADKVAIYLNDTHPALAIPELMRLLLDEYGLGWERAWGMCARMFSYTNHTLLPEALETWPLDAIGALLPRHLEIILKINSAFLADVRNRHHHDDELARRMSLIDERGERRVRMAHLSVVASHKVNGVSLMHTDLMRQTIFADFARHDPDRFVSRTNGIAHRRWLGKANPALARLLDAEVDPG
jgi:starch phosphorylase